MSYCLIGRHPVSKDLKIIATNLPKDMLPDIAKTAEKQGWTEISKAKVQLIEPIKTDD